jgi:tetratricopeptide (TPR) repeat protein
MEDVMKRTSLILSILIILAMVTSPTWAQVGPVKQQEPKDAMTYLRLGGNHFKANRYMAAVEAYKQAIHLNPDFAAAYQDPGYVYDELGRYKEALESYKRVIQLTPNDARIYSNMAVTCRKVGRYKEAVASCQQAINLRPDFAEAQGVAYYKMRRSRQAIESYKLRFEVGTLLEDHA